MRRVSLAHKRNLSLYVSWNRSFGRLPTIKTIWYWYFSVFRCLAYKLSMFVMFINRIPLLIAIFLSLVMQIIFLEKQRKP